MKRELILYLILTLFLITNVYAQVSITELSGTPKITSCIKDITFYSGYSSQGTLEVVNLGQQAGQFDLVVTCNKNSVSGSGNIGFIEAEESTLSSILISGTSGTENPLVAICTYTIKDRKSEKQDSCSSPVIIKSCNVCSIGTEKCENGNLMECMQNGCDYELKQTCQSGCSWDKKLTKNSCNENIEKADYSVYLYLLLILIVVILVIIIIKRKRK